MEFQQATNHIREGLRTTKGRNVLTFLVFLVISAIFWCLLTLNDDVQKDFTVPVQFVDFPEDVTFLTGINPALNVSVKDKGSALIRFTWGGNPTLRLRPEDVSVINDSTILLSQDRINAALRGLFGSSSTIVTMRPDSLRVTLTHNKGIKLPVEVKSQIHTQPQYAYAGHPIIEVDSVVIFSNSSRRYKMQGVSTPMISLENLSDTASVDVRLDVPAGMRAVPTVVTVKFPVEPLVTRQQSLPIEVVNAPEGTRVVTFPAMATLSYLIPKSMFNVPCPVKSLQVDYKRIATGQKSVAIESPQLPSYYRSVGITPSQVAYVIERAD